MGADARSGPRTMVLRKQLRRSPEPGVRGLRPDMSAGYTEPGCVVLLRVGSKNLSGYQVLSASYEVRSTKYSFVVLSSSSERRRAS